MSNYMRALSSSYTQEPSGEPSVVTFYTCLRCGGLVIEHGPNLEARTVHDLWHLAFGLDLTVPPETAAKADAINGRTGE